VSLNSVMSEDFRDCAYVASGLEKLILRNPSEWSTSGIYVIEVKTDDGIMRYVGSSRKINNRINHHFRDLKRGKNGCGRLQELYFEYGEPAFNVRMIEACPESMLYEREAFWIKELGAQLNIVKAGRRTDSGWQPEQDLFDAETPRWDPYEYARAAYKDYEKATQSPIGCPMSFSQEEFNRHGFPKGANA